MEEEERLVRRGRQENQELRESQAAQVLQVHRVPEGSEVNLDREGLPAFLDLRVDQDQVETQDQLEGVELTDRRVNQEIQVIKVFQDHQDPEECRVRMAKTVMVLQDIKVSREILVSLVTLVCWVKTACRGLKDIQDVKGTEVEAGTQAGRENQAGLENKDIQETGVPEVLLEAKARLSAS